MHWKVVWNINWKTYTQTMDCDLFFGWNKTTCTRLCHCWRRHRCRRNKNNIRFWCRIEWLNSWLPAVECRITNLSTMKTKATNLDSHKISIIGASIIVLPCYFVFYVIWQKKKSENEKSHAAQNGCKFFCMGQFLMKSKSHTENATVEFFSHFVLFDLGIFPSHLNTFSAH